MWLQKKGYFSTGVMLSGGQVVLAIITYGEYP